jgi:hypothetical protein
VPKGKLTGPVVSSNILTNPYKRSFTFGQTTLRKPRHNETEEHALAFTKNDERWQVTRTIQSLNRLKHAFVVIFIPDDRKVEKLCAQQWLSVYIVKHGSPEHGVVGTTADKLRKDGWLQMFRSR